MKNFIKLVSKRIQSNFCLFYFSLFKPTFKFNGYSLKYFVANYNKTWMNERTIEIPIVNFFLNNFQKKSSVLEIGNVFSHYFPISHFVVDKYEKNKGVLNEDVVSFKGGPFDLIFSISTLEHVGWDEVPKYPEKIFIALKNLKKLLKKDGVLIVTIPLGYNAFIDKNFKEFEAFFTEKYFFERKSFCLWKQVEHLDFSKPLLYNYPYPAANYLFVGILKKQKFK